MIPFKSSAIFDASVRTGSADQASVVIPISKYYDNYAELTVNNIFVKFKSGVISGYGHAGGGNLPSLMSLSYSSDDGNLTIWNAGNPTLGGFFYSRGTNQTFTICIVR